MRGKATPGRHEDATTVRLRSRLALPAVRGRGSVDAQFVIQSVDAQDQLAGTYTNYGAGFGCAGKAFPVTDWIDGDMISFTVHRKEPVNCTTIQAWTGLIKGSDRYRRQ